MIFTVFNFSTLSTTTATTTYIIYGACELANNSAEKAARARVRVSCACARAIRYSYLIDWIKRYMELLI